MSQPKTVWILASCQWRRKPFTIPNDDLLAQNLGMIFRNLKLQPFNKELRFIQKIFEKKKVIFPSHLRLKAWGIFDDFWSPLGKIFWTSLAQPKKAHTKKDLWESNLKVKLRGLLGFAKFTSLFLLKTSPVSGLQMMIILPFLMTHRIHVWYIYLHLPWYIYLHLP